MANMKWMDLMGIGAAKPTASNCPLILSAEVRKVWPEIIANNISVIAGMQHEMAWNFALSAVFSITSGDGLEWLDSRFSGRPAFEKVKRDVTARRALMVVAVDVSKSLADLNIDNIQREVDYKIGQKALILRTTADCRLVRGVAEVEWLSNLVKNRFKVFGHKYDLWGLPTGCKVSFDVNPAGGIQFVSEMQVPCVYIPPDSATPLISPAIFAKVMTDKVLLPAVRTFKYKTTRRKTSLL